MSFFGFRFGWRKRPKLDDQPREETWSTGKHEETYYDVLGINQNATADDIKAAYRHMAFETHPDRHPDDPLATAKFIRVQLAYETLISPKLRAKYDLQQITFASSGSYWSPTVEITISFNYYGYEIPLDTMQQAQQDAIRLAAQSGTSEAEAMAYLLLDPLIAETKRELGQRPRDMGLLLQMADLNFHTYRSFEALQYYTRAFEQSPTWQTAARFDHLERAFHYANDFWGGVSEFARLLTIFQNAPREVRQRWATDGSRLLSSAETAATKGIPPDQKLPIKLSILEKKREFGYQPRYRDHKSIADVAIAVGDSAVAREHLAMARSFPLDAYEVASLMRSYIRESLFVEACALGEQLLTPEHLKRTLGDGEKLVCRVLAEAYERANRVADALTLYKKLSRYRDTGGAIKKKVERLEARSVSRKAMRRKRAQLMPPSP